MPLKRPGNFRNRRFFGPKAWGQIFILTFQEGNPEGGLICLPLILPEIRQRQQGATTLMTNYTKSN
jgi:hypothetical protein